MSLTEFADRGFHSQSNTIEFYQVLLAGTHLVVLFQTLEVGGDEPVLPVVGRQAVDDDDGRVRMRQDERLDGAEREQRLALGTVWDASAPAAGSRPPGWNRVRLPTPQLFGMHRSHHMFILSCLV